MAYLLDTNILAAMAREPGGPVTRHLRNLPATALYTSVIVTSEIKFGLKKKASPKLTSQMNQILDLLTVLPLGAEIETHYAEIRWHLEKAGTPIGPNDLFIAAQARVQGLVLVTDNTREFHRVPGLKIENWLEKKAL